jgi:hypothetical protein
MLFSLLFPYTIAIIASPLRIPGSLAIEYSKDSVPMYLYDNDTW